MQNYGLRMASIAALSTSLTSTIAMAQVTTAADPEANTDRILDEITVVGNVLHSSQVNSLKSPTPILDVPQSLSIMNAEDIAKRGLDSLGDIINYIPGVSNTQGEGHRDAIVFRGVRSTADFFVDGVRDDVQYYRPLYNLEQVEILRGPNALLFGRGGTGGIVNRVTKKADLDQAYIGYAANLDSFGAYDVAIDANHTTHNAAAFRLNAYYESLNNHRDFFDGDNFGINPTARFELDTHSTLDLSYEYANHERFVDRGIPTGTDGAPVEAFKDIVFGDRELNTTKFSAHVLRANLQHRFGESLKGSITASLGSYDKFYQNFYASGYDEAITPNQVTLDGYVDTTQRQRAMLAGNLIGEYDTGGIAHTLIGGVEMIYTSNNNDRNNARWSSNNFTDDNDTFLIAQPLNLSGGVGVNASGVVTTNNFGLDVNDDNEADLKVYSLFIQDEIAINDKINVLIGGRFDSFDINVDNVKDSTSAGRTDNVFSPRLGIVLKPYKSMSIYASYSESFLPSSGGQYASAGNLDPDVYKQSEIGLKWDFFTNASFTAAYFQNNETSASFDPLTEEQIEVRGQEVSGFELQLQGSVTDRLFFTTGYSYLDGKTDGGADIPREIPKNMFSIWGNYDITNKLGLGMGLIYQDEAFITDYTIGDTDPHPTLPAFTRVDATAFYDISDRLRVQLNIENLTDEVYFPSSHSTHQVTVGAPLNVSVGISGRF